MPSISVPLIFVAGHLSFFSPRVLPMAPIYLGYLSGSSLSGSAPIRRWHILGHALLFVAGFTSIFVILFGLPATMLAHTLQRFSGWITKIGGAVLVLFGLHTMGIMTIPALGMSGRLDLGRGMESGYPGSALFGVAFAAGWTPCVGPLLGAAMTLAFTEPSRAMLLLWIDTLGLAIPFLAMAALLTRAVGWLERLNRPLRWVEIASGFLTVGLGILLMGGPAGRAPMLLWLWLGGTPEQPGMLHPSGNS